MVGQAQGSGAIRPRVALFVALVAVALLALALPQASQARTAKPRVTVAGNITDSGVLRVKGRVRPARSAWRVRIQARVSRISRSGRSRTVWVRKADSALLKKSGRYRVRFAAGGASITIRPVVMAGRRVIKRGRSRTIVAPRPPGGADGQPAPPAAGGAAGPPPPAPPTTASPPGAPAGSDSTPTTTPPSEHSSLTAGKSLAPGDALVSPNGRYRLVMQGSDGNLVLYDGASSMWSTGAHGGGARAVMQSDGNFVVYNGTAVKWSSNTAGFDGSTIRLQDDGNLVIYYAGRAIWTWSNEYRGHVLDPGQNLQPGRMARSRNGQYRLIMQTDGNLVLYKGTQALWARGNGAGAHAVMQSDGNFVVYNGTAVKWSSSSGGFGGATLVVQDDGNAVVYHSGHAIWTWGSGYIGDTLGSGATLNPGAYLKSPNKAFTLIMQASDGNLALYGPSGALWGFGTSGHPGARAVMQSDGNFVVYAGSSALKATDTSTPGSVIRVQDDDNLVVYSGSTALWSRKGVQGPVNISNAAIADRAETRPNGTYLGETNGECLRFVSDMIVEAGGPRWWFGFDDSTYQAQWAARAAEVGSLGEARRGDIIQWGGGAGGSLDPHTAIVTSQGADPQIIDSNFGAPHRVYRGAFSSRNGSDGRYRIWRVGRA